MEQSGATSRVSITANRVSTTPNCRYQVDAYPGNHTGPIHPRHNHIPHPRLHPSPHPQTIRHRRRPPPPRRHLPNCRHRPRIRHSPQPLQLPSSDPPQCRKQYHIRSPGANSRHLQAGKCRCDSLVVCLIPSQAGVPVFLPEIDIPRARAEYLVVVRLDVHNNRWYCQHRCFVVDLSVFYCSGSIV